MFLFRKLLLGFVQGNLQLRPRKQNNVRKLGRHMIGKVHCRPQSPRSFWPTAGIKSSVRTRFCEHAQSNRFVFSANHNCQI